jgi:hypothetical protein
MALKIVVAAFFALYALSLLTERAPALIVQ